MIARSPLAARGPELSGDNEVLCLRVKVNTSVLRKMPCREDLFDGVGEAVRNGGRKVSIRDGGVCLLDALLQDCTASFDVCDGVIEDERLAYFAPVCPRIRRMTREAW